ncbi:MAG TPA: AAA family ATPase [Candidatus Limnocylindria bacterium]|nr:AAA family ATPase [Candidatus Limnocylindria bacterium]
MKNTSKKFITPLDGPILDKVKVHFTPTVNFNHYPFSLPIIKNLKDIEFPTQVTFFIGENGAGKSTILEAIANKAGFGPEGGSKNINFKTSDEQTYTGIQEFAQYTTLSWRMKPQNGYFFRAESFFNVANYLDTIEREGGGGAYTPYGGKSLHEQSHGESFLSFFKNRLGNSGFFIFDEPEAALSPQRQLALLVIIHEACKNPNSQFIIATHSPILLAYPGTTIYSCDGDRLKTIRYTDTDHYQITKRFLDNPTHYLQHLFNEKEE